MFFKTTWEVMRKLLDLNIKIVGIECVSHFIRTNVQVHGITVLSVCVKYATESKSV